MLMERVNTIVQFQTGVGMTPSGGGLLRDLQVPSFTGGRVQLEDQRQFLAMFASSDLDRDAEYHVIFARGIDIHAAANWPNRTFWRARSIRSALLRMSLFTFSPRKVRARIHDKLKSELMFDGPAEGRGILMHRERLLRTRFSRPGL